MAALPPVSVTFSPVHTEEEPDNVVMGPKALQTMLRIVAGQDFQAYMKLGKTDPISVSRATSTTIRLRS
jgi:hypothetical protein